jgi:3-methyladenine DNA glycosylase AlkD
MSNSPRLAEALTLLRAKAVPEGRAGMARYNIPSDNALGVPMREIQAIAKTLGRDHALAQALFKTNIYEAQTLAAYVAEPAALTPALMDRWCRSFDSWAICDSMCFALFDRSPHAWGRVPVWAARPQLYVRRAAFALVWGLSVHDKAASDDAFVAALALIETHAGDDRPHVAKALSMALRATGKRNATLRKHALALAKRLAAQPGRAEQALARLAIRELGS